MLWMHASPSIQTSQFAPFVGRAGEVKNFTANLRALLQQPADTSASHQHIFVIHGESGMGKTALLRHFRAVAEQVGLPTQRIVALDCGRGHYASTLALAEALAAAVRQRFAGFDTAFQSALAQRRRVADDFRDLQSQWARWTQLQQLGQAEVDALLQHHYRVQQQRVVRQKIFGAEYPATGVSGQVERLIDDIAWVLQFRDERGQNPGSFDELLEYRLGPANALLLRSEHALGRALAHDLNRLAKDAPLLLSIDRYEHADQHDPWLRTSLLAHTSERVFVAVAGRRRLDASYHITFGGQQGEPVAYYDLNQPLGPDDIQHYLVARLSLPKEPPAAATNEVANISQGVPLAVAALGDQLANGGSPAVFRDLQPDDDDLAAFQRALIMRFFRQVLGARSGEPGAARSRSRDRQRIRAIALLLRPDPELAWSIWGVSPEEGQQIARDLAERYTFAFAGSVASDMHELARECAQEDLLDARHRPLEWQPIEVGLRRAIEVVQDRIAQADQRLAAPDERYADARWSDATLDLLNMLLWLGERERASKILLNHWVRARHASPAFADWLFEQAAQIAPQTTDWRRMLAALQSEDYDMLGPFAGLLEPQTYAVLCFLRANRVPAGSGADEAARRLDQRIALLHEGYQRDASWPPLRRALYEALSARASTLLYQRKDYHAARGDFDALIRLAPDSAAQLRGRGAARQLAGDVAGALEDYDRALHIQPDDAPTRFHRGVIRQQLGLVEDARDDFTAALAQHPTDAVARYHRAVIQHQLGQLVDALHDLGVALRQRPNNASALRLRALVLADLAAYAPTLWDAALSDLDNAHVLNPGDPDTLSQRGAVLVRRNNIAEALKDLDAALVRQPDHALAHFWRGRARAAQGRLDEALDDLNQALALDPDNAEAYGERGAVRQRLAAAASPDAQPKLLGAALADFDQALALRPDQPQPLWRRALVESDRGNLERALADIERSLALDPHSPDAYAARGDLLEQVAGATSNPVTARQALEAARDDYSTALALRPDDPNVLFRRGHVHNQLDARVAAQIDFDAALALRPNDPATLLARGLVLQELNNPAGAEADFTRALDLAADKRDALAARGRVRLEQGKLREAEQDLATALRLHNGDTQLHAQIAATKLKQGDYLGAAPHYWATLRSWASSRISRRSEQQ